MIAAILLAVFVASRPWRPAADVQEKANPEPRLGPPEASATESDKGLTPEHRERFWFFQAALSESVDLSSMN